MPHTQRAIQLHTKFTTEFANQLTRVSKAKAPLTNRSKFSRISRKSACYSIDYSVCIQFTKRVRSGPLTNHACNMSRKSIALLVALVESLTTQHSPLCPESRGQNAFL